MLIYLSLVISFFYALKCFLLKRTRQEVQEGTMSTTTISATDFKRFSGVIFY